MTIDADIEAEIWHGKFRVRVGTFLSLRFCNGGHNTATR